MTPCEIITYCQNHGIKLEPTDHGTIVIDIPDMEKWSDELTEAVKRHKPELIRILQVKSTFEDSPSVTCGNRKCLYQCAYIYNLDKCPWLLDEGTHKWKDGEWKRVLH